MQQFATVKKTAELYAGTFSESSLRWLIFNRDTNGFSKCIAKIGRKVLIDLGRMESWLRSHQEMNDEY